MPQAFCCVVRRRLVLLCEPCPRRVCLEPQTCMADWWGSCFGSCSCASCCMPCSERSMALVDRPGVAVTDKVGS